MVVGAGLIGTETAATLAAAHEVTLVDMLDRPLARLLPEVSDAAVEVQLSDRDNVNRDYKPDFGTNVAALSGSPEQDAKLFDGCDVVVSAAGFRSSLPPELAGLDARALTLPADERRERQDHGEGHDQGAEDPRAEIGVLRNICVETV